MEDSVMDWLLAGDVAIQYQTHRDLLGQERPDLRRRIPKEGWGARFLAARTPGDGWGKGFYQPKWTSTHYTLLDLVHLGFPPDHPALTETVDHALQAEKGSDGGINPAATVGASDACINGMFLSYACYARRSEERLRSVIDFVLSQRMDDGGFNCRKNRSGARHSSLHSTISVLEGLCAYRDAGYTYRRDECRNAQASAEEFVLIHRFFKSDHTGEVIHPQFLTLSHPPRWRYNILRALDYFRAAGRARDERMTDALEVLVHKQRRDGTWPLQAAHPGDVHFRMESPRGPSRWITLAALRVLARYGS